MQAAMGASATEQEMIREAIRQSIADERVRRLQSREQARNSAVAARKGLKSVIVTL